MEILRRHGVSAENNSNTMVRRAGRMAGRAVLAAAIMGSSVNVVSEGHEPLVYKPIPQEDFKDLMTYNSNPFSSPEIVSPEPSPTAHPNSNPRRPEIVIFNSTVPQVSRAHEQKKVAPNISNNSKSSGWKTDPEISWYGPGFYGNRTACGEKLTTDLVGVASRTLACGTIVDFKWNGKVIKVPVVDRGPYVSGRIFDLTGGACMAFSSPAHPKGHCFTGSIEYKVEN